MQADLAAGDRKRCRQIRNKTVHDRLDLASQNRIDRAAHSRVAHERRTAGKNLLVRCLHMRVGANYGGDLSIKKPPECDFLARGLAVHIHNNVAGLFAHFFLPLFPRPETDSPKSVA